LRRFRVNGVLNKLQNKYLARSNSRREIIYGDVHLCDITPILAMVAGSMLLALLILVIEKMYYSFKTRFKNNESVKKLNHNFNVRNQLQKRNERNLKLQAFYNRPIGYLP